MSDARFTAEYIALRRERDRLKQLVAGGSVLEKPVKPYKKPTPTVHGSLDPTDGRTGKTVPAPKGE